MGEDVRILKRDVLVPKKAYEFVSLTAKLVRQIQIRSPEMFI